MGANLVGFMVVGPREVDPGPRQIARIADRVAEHREFFARWVRSGNADTTHPSYDYADWVIAQHHGEWPSTPDDVQSLFATGREDRLVDPESVDLPYLFNPYLDSPDDVELRAWVEELAELWNGLCSADLVVRELDEYRVCVFAGEMTWGDEPMGSGYCALRALDCSGVMSELGIS